MEVTNRFKGLDLIDRVPEEIWTEANDIVQEAVIKTIPKKKKCKNAKWLSEEALQIAEKRREAKGKEKRYIHLNAEFQRITGSDKKALLSDQCKEIEENNRMGKIRDIFKFSVAKLKCPGSVFSSFSRKKGVKLSSLSCFSDNEVYHLSS